MIPALSTNSLTVTLSLQAELIDYLHFTSYSYVFTSTIYFTIYKGTSQSMLIV